MSEFVNCPDCGECHPADYTHCPKEACRRTSRRRKPVQKYAQAFGTPKGRGGCYEAAGVISDHSERDVYLLGKNGTGKTHRMVGMAHFATVCYFTRDDSQLGADWWKGILKWVDCSEIFQMLRESFREKSSLSERTIIADLVTVQTLFIDDMGAEKITTFTLAALCQILRQREQADRRTVITSNHSVSEVADADPRIGSLLAGYEVVALTGKDRRKDRQKFSSGHGQ